MEYSKKSSNKISEIVRLQQILKKWKKLANSSPKSYNNNFTTNKKYSSSASTNTSTNGSSSSSSNKSINKFLKKTLSFNNDSSSTSSSSNMVSTDHHQVDFVPKGFLAVCVGKEKELKRFIIPTEYLSHQAFQILLREAEEEFGFQQEGVLKIPCEVGLFQKILKVVEEKRDHRHVLFFLNNNNNNPDIKLDDDQMMMMNINNSGCCCSSTPDSDQLTPSHIHPQLYSR